MIECQMKHFNKCQSFFNNKGCGFEIISYGITLIKLINKHDAVYIYNGKNIYVVNRFIISYKLKRKLLITLNK